MLKLIQFGLIGFINTALTICTYAFLVYICDIDYLIANIIGYFLGMVNSYIWNKIWVFQVKGNQLQYIPKFVIVNLALLTINSLSLLIMVNIFHMNKMFSQIFVIGYVTVLNFVLTKNWTFSRKELKVE